MLPLLQGRGRYRYQSSRIRVGRDFSQSSRGKVCLIYYVVWFEEEDHRVVAIHQKLNIKDGEGVGRIWPRSTRILPGP